MSKICGLLHSPPVVGGLATGSEKDTSKVKYHNLWKIYHRFEKNDENKTFRKKTKTKSIKIFIAC